VTLIQIGNIGLLETSDPTSK